MQVDVYLQHSCVLEQFGATAVDLVCDSRSILIGFSDGTFQLLSWQSQVGPALLSIFALTCICTPPARPHPCHMCWCLPKPPPLDAAAARAHPALCLGVQR